MDIITLALAKKFAKEYTDTHASKITEEDAIKAVANYFNENPNAIVTKNELEIILDNIPAGNDGKSAYECAQEGGFEGTEEEWLESLRYDHSDEFAILAEQVRNNTNTASEAAQTAAIAANAAAGAANDALGAKNAAEDLKNATQILKGDASASKEAAAASERKAKDSETVAGQSASNAADSAGAAATAKNEAEKAKNAAELAAGNASASETNAKASENAAAKASSDAIAAKEEIQASAEQIAKNKTDIGELKSDLVILSNDLIDFVNTDKLKLPSVFVDGNLEDNGEIVPYNNRYTSEKYIKVSLDCTLNTSSPVVICLYNDNLSVISRTVYRDNIVTISKNSIFRICVIGFNNSVDARESVYFYPHSSFKNVLDGSNICFNNSTIPNGSTFDFNKSFESKIYEFDIGFNNTKVLNAPFYPFKGTAIVFSPCGIKEQYKGDLSMYYAVGTVQMVFKSRNVFDYDGTYYIRCYLSGGDDKPMWSEWKEYKEAEYFNSKFNDIDSKFNDIYGSDLFQCFENFCVIGDSISAGYTNIGGVAISSATARLRGANWPSYLSISLSREVLNLAEGGSATIDWRNTLKENISKKECFIIYLGGNDMATNYNLGTDDDIKADYNDNTESYYGNYDYLVRYIHERYPNSVIFCISNTFFDNNKYATYNIACNHISNLYEYCHYIDITDEVNKQNDFLSKNFNGHFSPIGYKVYEKCIRNSINKYMYENYNKFLGVPYSTD